MVLPIGCLGERVCRGVCAVVAQLLVCYKAMSRLGLVRGGENFYESGTKRNFSQAGFHFLNFLLFHKNP